MNVVGILSMVLGLLCGLAGIVFAVVSVEEQEAALLAHPLCQAATAFFVGGAILVAAAARRSA